MAIINTFTSVTPDVISLGGTAQVTVGLTAIPGLLAQPADIVMVIDNTEGIKLNLMEEIKNGARKMVDAIAIATGGTPYGTIPGGTKIGVVVMHQGTAVTAAQLTDDVVQLEAVITAITGAEGTTNVHAAVTNAVDVISMGTNPNKAIVFYSFNASSEGGSPDAVFEDAKARGIRIFCLGPSKRGQELIRWASKPSSCYLSTTIDGIDLARAFVAAAGKMTQPSTTAAVINSSISPDFEIVGVVSQSIGTGTILTPNTLKWDIGSIGAAAQETGTLLYDVRHIAETVGEKPVTSSILYTDKAENQLMLENPEVLVRAGGGTGGPVYPEPCPAVNDFQVSGCRDAVQVETTPVEISSLGRIVQVDAVVKNVCPGKQVAVAVLLSEMDSRGVEHARGTKTVLIPPQDGEVCRDVVLKCIHFVVPEALDASGAFGSICNARSFTARVLANYVDTDYVACCAPQAVTL